jgi:ribosome-associated translation inhibitor RaiA
MKPSLRITARKFALPADAEALIRREAAKLDEFHDAIAGCRVLIDVEERKYAVRIDVDIRGGELLVTLSTQADLDTALQHGFDASHRQVREHARRLEIESEAGRVE